MAIKTFKIGLSDAEKQAMAQEIYERLLDLTFPEYDTSTQYSVGDFVVYNDQLYKCIGATSGAWDSSKWQLATMNDLLTDIEDAVQFVNDKANVDGNYPTMTVGVADQLSPYDEESGDDQDEPFSFQATGTGNGSQPDFSTGSIALMKEKRGNTVVVNQLFYNTNPSETISGITFTRIDDTTLTISGTATNRVSWSVQQGNINVKTNHYYLIMGMENNNQNVGLIFNAYNSGGYVTTYSGIDTGNGLIVLNNNPNVTILVCECLVPDGTTLSKTYTIKPKVIDLTQMFNGDIPADLLAHPENFFRYYQGSLAYNEGTLVNANSRYVKCIGRNQWDEEYEQGSIISSTGAITHETSEIVSKNFIEVIPNVTYFAKCPTTTWITIGEYDKDYNFIRTQDKQNETFTVSSNCCYIKIGTNNLYLTTYNHDITISIYYEGESGYDQYYPYEVLTNNDTGVEVLRSAGSIHDVKKPDGTIERNVGVVADMSTLNWHATGNQVYAKVDGMQDNNQSVVNVMCPKWIAMNSIDISTPHILQADGYVNIFGMNFADHQAILDATSGVPLFFDLKEPTTEQGTPYSENLVIDDFGSMDFQGTSGVPQGNLIFYPVDYKAFIDTLYDNTEGTPSNIALKSDLSADKTELQGVDTQLQNAIGGTLRQCLCVKESLDFDNTDFVDLGTLSYGIETTNVFVATFTQAKASSKLLCSKYKSVNAYADVTSTDKSAYVGGDGGLYIHDSSYNDVTAFKATMKGVLLAYEKASE